MARSPARSSGLLFTWYDHWQLQPLFILTLAGVLLSRECVSGQPELQVAYITTDDGAYVSNGSIPAVMLAIEQVNNLSDYKLVLNRDGSPRSTSVSLWTFLTDKFGRQHFSLVCSELYYFGPFMLFAFRLCCKGKWFYYQFILDHYMCTITLTSQCGGSTWRLEYSVITLHHDYKEHLCWLWLEGYILNWPRHVVPWV